MWTPDEKVVIASTALTNMNPEYKLDFWQVWYLKSMFKYLIVNKSRRIGWSYITSLKGVIEANSPDTKYQMVYASYGMHDAVGKITDARNALMNLPEKWSKPIASDSKTSLEFWDAGRKSKSMLISLPSRTLRGFGTSNPWGGVSLDEFAFHKDDEKVFVSALPCLMRGGLLSVGSTPLVQAGMFYDILTNKDKYKGWTRQEIPWWWATVACNNVPEAISKAPFMSTYERVEKYGSLEIINACATMSLQQFQQEFECMFTDESEAFISLEMIRACTPEQVEQYEYQSISEFLAGVNLDNICVGITPDGQPIFENVHAPAYDPDIHGDLYAGWDMGRHKHASILTIIGHIGAKKKVWMTYEMRNKTFDEQKEMAKLVLASLPIRRFLIDKNGLGMDFAEWAEKTFPTIAFGVEFSNASKEDMANKMYLGFERQEFVLPMNKYLHADIHCIKKTVTAMKYNRYDGSTKDSHADRFWSMALANVAIEESAAGTSRFYSSLQKGRGGEELKNRESTKKTTGNSQLDAIIKRGQRSRRNR